MKQPSLGDSAFSILTVLAGGDRHGYAIIKEADEISGGRIVLKVSSLYAALERLESEGLVARAGDKAVDGRLRRYFTLTDEGSKTLCAEVERLEAQVSAARKRLAGRGSPLASGGAA